MRWALASDPGRVRGRNEDACAAFALPRPEGAQVFAVADGLGGHPAGDVASRLAVRLFQDHLADWSRRLAAPPGAEELRAALVDGVRHAHAGLMAAARRDGRLRGMGTTMTAVLLVHGWFAFAHVGDSRLYRVAPDALVRLSRDHVVPAARHMLTQALGLVEPLEIDSGSGRIGPGEGLLLCTDGLTAVVTDEEIWHALRRLPVGSAVSALVALANRRGGPDNITLAAVFADAAGTRRGEGT